MFWKNKKHKKSEATLKGIDLSDAGKSDANIDAAFNILKLKARSRENKSALYFLSLAKFELEK